MSQMTEEQIAWVEESTRRAATKALKKYTLGAMLAFVVLLVGFALAGRAYLATLHDGLVGSCHRVNTLRAQSNISDTVSFSILSISGRREQALIKLNPAAAAEHRQSAEALFSQARNLTITRLTDCDKAVSDPKDYVTPVAGPIGDPKSGNLALGVAKVIENSKALLHEEKTANATR